MPYLDTQAGTDTSYCGRIAIPRLVLTRGYGPTRSGAVRRGSGDGFLPAVLKSATLLRVLCEARYRARIGWCARTESA
eukprot:2839814-Rhodomonas_salina.4